MATRAELMRALSNADKAGDVDAARKLAAEIRRISPIPNEPYMGEEIKRVPPKDYSIFDELIGGAEAAATAITGATTGALGFSLGAIDGIGREIAEGKFGEGTGIPLESAMRGASNWTYAPRTETGQRNTKALGEAMQMIPPVIPVIGQAGALTSAVAPTVARTAAVASKVAAPVIAKAQPTIDKVHRAVAPVSAEISIGRRAHKASEADNDNRWLQMQREILKSNPELVTPENAHLLNVDPVTPVRPPVTESATPKDKSVGDMEVPIEAIRRRDAAEVLGDDAPLTKGQASNSLPQQQFEREMAKNAEFGGPIRERFALHNVRLQHKMDRMITEAGGNAMSSRETGLSIDAALESRAARNKLQINNLYKIADKNGEMEAPSDLSPVAEYINKNRTGRSAAPILKYVADEAKVLEIADGNIEDGSFSFRPLTIKQAEELRKSINENTDETNGKDLWRAVELKQLIDAQTEGLGGKYYRKARMANVRYMKDYENIGLVKNLMGTKRGSDDRAIAFEDVLKKAILSNYSSLDSVRHLRRVLRTQGDEGKQAWKNIQSDTIAWIKKEATTSINRDEQNNPIVSAYQLNKAVTSLDKNGKLDFVLGKKTANMIRVINDVAKHVSVSQPGSIGTSNSATQIALLLDMGLISTGVAPPVATMLKMAASKIKDLKLKNRIKDALRDDGKDSANTTSVPIRESVTAVKSPIPVSVKPGEINIPAPAKINKPTPITESIDNVMPIQSETKQHSGYRDTSIFVPQYRFKDGGIATESDYEKSVAYSEYENSKQFVDDNGLTFFGEKLEDVAYAPQVSKEIPAAKIPFPERTRFMTQENVDNISRAIIAVKQGLIKPSSFNLITEKNLPLPPESGRGSNMAGDIYNGTVRDNLVYHFGRYLSGLRIPHKDSMTGKVLRRVKANPVNYEFSKSGEGAYSVRLKGDKYSSWHVKAETEDDAKKQFFDERDGRIKYITDGENESGYAVGSKQFDIDPDLYDIMVREFRKNPAKLLQSVLNDIKSRRNEEDADLFFFEEAIKDAKRMNYEETPEGRRKKIHIVSNVMPIQSESGPKIDSSNRQVVNKSDDTIQIYSGSPDEITSIRNDGVFGGIFASADESTARSHGDFVHTIDIPKKEILTQYEMEYELDYPKIASVLKREVQKGITEEELDNVYDAVVKEDVNFGDMDEVQENRMLEIFRSENKSDALFEMQRIRGEIAREFGFKAVEMDDEHGTSYLVLPGVKIRPYDKNNDN